MTLGCTYSKTGHITLLVVYHLFLRKFSEIYRKFHHTILTFMLVRSCGSGVGVWTNSVSMRRNFREFSSKISPVQYHLLRLSAVLEGAPAYSVSVNTSTVNLTRHTSFWHVSSEHLNTHLSEINIVFSPVRFFLWHVFNYCFFQILRLRVRVTFDFIWKWQRGFQFGGGWWHFFSDRFVLNWRFFDFVLWHFSFGWLALNNWRYFLSDRLVLNDWRYFFSDQLVLNGRRLFFRGSFPQTLVYVSTLTCFSESPWKSDENSNYVRWLGRRLQRPFLGILSP